MGGTRSRTPVLEGRPGTPAARRRTRRGTTRAMPVSGGVESRGTVSVSFGAATASGSTRRPRAIGTTVCTRLSPTGQRWAEPDSRSVGSPCVGSRPHGKSSPQSSSRSKTCSIEESRHRPTKGAMTTLHPGGGLLRSNALSATLQGRRGLRRRPRHLPRSRVRRTARPRLQVAAPPP